ncbi:MAG: BamA/TamA family outer membrane protein [Candidatus Limisoma sp.]|nr:BamA/TamA family outer membrane protein [Bacteroidales bacterium]MDD6669816.1 BamA/TamA family outer membrane protein [Bacteroidales bacterium]
MNRLFCLLSVALLTMSPAMAAPVEPVVDCDTVPVDTLTVEGMSLLNDTLAVDTALNAKPKGFFGKLKNYFKKSEHFNPNKKIDFGILGGPHYSSATGVGLGIVASGLYRIDRNDPQLPLSNVSIFSNVTSKGLLMVGVRGNNVFPRERFRLDYTTYIYTFPSTLWGIGYEQGNNDDNETNYSRLKFEAKPRFLVRLAPHTYIGPLVNVQYINITDFDQSVADLMGCDERKFTTFGGGLSFTYDSRDIILNATRGWFVQLDQIFNPSWLGNDHVYHWTDLTVSTYHKAWRGAVIAGEFHSMFNYNDVPWPMLATVGGQSRMRGYFEGRYRDKNIMEAQIELRQHIKKRHGIVVWVGAANVFPKFSEMRLKHTLPNFGTGYRWRFKQGVNVRLDLGLTRNGMGFIFNINEAF